jgi:hypothetical protein
LLNVCTAFAADPHWPAATADEIALSWLFIVLAWLVESRLLPPPQATTSVLVNPSPPARSARGA